jgi:hypothetical protein
MLQTISNETHRIYSGLTGVQAAAFSFWFLCVACFCSIAGYIVYLGAADLIKRILPKRK